MQTHVNLDTFFTLGKAMTIQWQSASFSTSFIPFSESVLHQKPMSIFQDNLSQLKTYSSEFKLINKAIQRILKSDLKSEVAWKIFNDTITDYREVMNPFPVISCLQDLQKLEIQLEEYSLGRLWNVLSDIINEPQIKTIEQKRKWFQEKKNQPLLDTITVLELQVCGLISLPKEIYQLRNLKKLDLSQNQLEFLEESIKIWTQLEELNLCCNELTDLPHNGIKYLINLTNLNVSSNALKHLPRSIKYLTNLETLNVEENYLEELPKRIGQCTSLKALTVSSNQLSQLPKELKDLTSLVEFSAADNELKYSSEELQALGVNSWKQIEKVDLSQNYQNTTVEFLKTLRPSASTIMHSHYEKV